MDIIKNKYIFLTEPQKKPSIKINKIQHIADNIFKSLEEYENKTYIIINVK